MSKIGTTEELLSLNGKVFVHQLYEGVLGRSPSEDEVQNQLSLLSLGRDKRDLLISFLTSDEGRVRHQTVQGATDMARQSKREKLPVIGIIFRLKNHIARMFRQTNLIEMRLENLEQAVLSRLTAVEVSLNDISKATAKAGATHFDKTAWLIARVENKVDELIDMSKSDTGNSTERLAAELLEIKHMLETSLTNLDGLKGISEGAFAEMWLKLNHLSSKI